MHNSRSYDINTEDKTIRRERNWLKQSTSNDDGNNLRVEPNENTTQNVRQEEKPSVMEESEDKRMKQMPSEPLTYLELFSRAKSRNKTIWLIPPVHHWCQGSRPGGCLLIDCSRRDQTTLTRFLSGHIRSLTFSDNSKCFEICPKCTEEQPDHILACLELSKQDLVSNPLLTLVFL
ncbi:hypothetical protein AVEN_171955-1 [Araneus ventricosus]|uniref:Uncharacterized protein n=1 Tax=Araneus ventricosus TaxID=182803 RepID=A0A4Y2P9V2_ARAVE|nr:hypothetical protein AVEN_171955-1 [Araneus ventricosus]